MKKEKNTLKILCYICMLCVFFGIIGIVVVNSLIYWYSERQNVLAHAETPIKTVFTIERIPIVGEHVGINCEITSDLDAPNTKVIIELPSDVNVISGKISWTGNLKTGKVIRLAPVISFGSTGKKTLRCKAISVINPGMTWGDMAELYLTIGYTDSMKSFEPVHPSYRDQVGSEDMQGEGIPTEQNPTYTNPSSDMTKPSTPSAPPNGVYNESSEPSEAPGELTITGRFRFHDRDDNLASEQFLVEVVRGDNSEHLAYCFSDISGYYTCGPFANPGSVGVRSRFLSYMQFSVNSDILVTVNPDWGTTGTVNNAFGTTTTVQSFTDGTQDIGSWNVTNGSDSERAYWIVADLIKVWKYIYFGAGQYQSPEESPGSSTVEWKIDSTNGTFYSQGGNIHLKGPDPISDTVVGHEYGHNIMYTVYGNSFPTSYCPSPHYIQSSSHVNCAWTEGWANFITMAANNDPVIRWSSGASINLETPTWETSGWDDGDDVEGRVAGAMWDVLDPINDGDDQYTENGIANFWDTIYNQNDNTFSDFWSAWGYRGHNTAQAVMSIYQNTIDYRNNGPANDNFSNAIQVNGSSGQDTGTNVDATKESGEPDHAGNAGGNSVWWRWTAPSSLDTHGSSFDTLLGVYVGSSVSSLTEVASNDDDGSSNYNSGLSFQATSGTTYHIAVDGYLGESGDVILNWSLTPTNPDLVVINPSVSDGTLTPGQSFIIYATVKNQGNGSGQWFLKQHHIALLPLDRFNHFYW